MKTAPPTSRVRTELLIPFRLRTVRIGIASTLLVLPTLVVFALLPSHGEMRVAPFLAVVLVGAMGVLVVALLPWARMFRSNLGVVALYLWSMMDIVLITVAIGFTGGGRSDLFLLYGLTTLFLISYPAAAQFVLVALTLVCYVGAVAVTGWDVGAGVFQIRLAVLAVLGLMGIFLARETQRQIEGNAAASEESERRASALATVARAARAMTSLEPEHVLESVVQAVGHLGFEASGIAVFDETGTTYRLGQARGLPAEFAAGVHPSTIGMPGLVRERRATVVVEDYSSHPRAVPILGESGFRAVAASPIWLGEELAAVLVGGTRGDRTLSQNDVDAFELLAAQAGTALDIARRFGEERRAVERLAELDRMKNEFLSMVSHELRTPLTVIEGMGKTLEQKWPDLNEATRLELLARLNANAVALDELIATLLDFARYQERAPAPHVEPVQLGGLVRSVVDRLETLFGPRTLDVEIEPDLPVRADRLLIERVVENLLSNAAKHTPEGSRVRIEVFRGGGSAVVRVVDDGPGIPPHELGRLGQRFFRGGDPNSRKTKGFGLGLALVREVLELHGSELTVASGPRGGAAFSFALALALRSEEAEPESAPAAASGAAPASAPMSAPVAVAAEAQAYRTLGSRSA